MITFAHLHRQLSAGSRCGIDCPQITALPSQHIHLSSNTLSPPQMSLSPSPPVAALISSLSSPPPDPALLLSPSAPTYAFHLLAHSPTPHVVGQIRLQTAEQLAKVDAALTEHIDANLSLLANNDHPQPPSQPDSQPSSQPSSQPTLLSQARDLHSQSQELSSLSAGSLASISTLQRSIEAKTQQLQNLLETQALLKKVMQVRVEYADLLQLLASPAMQPAGPNKSSNKSSKSPPVTSCSSMSTSQLSPLAPVLARLSTLLASSPALKDIALLAPCFQLSRSLRTSLASRADALTQQALQALPSPALPPLLLVEGTLGFLPDAIGRILEQTLATADADLDR